MLLLILALTLYSSVAQVNVRFPHQTPSVTGPSKDSTSECPSPLSVMTFLHKQICVHVCFAEKLAGANKLLEQQGLAEASAFGVQRLTGFRSGQTSLHGRGTAIDIDAATNPYLIHEGNETSLDQDLIVVYERIAQFLLGRPSIIPHLGVERRTKETHRASAARLYEMLAQESVAMQRYFVLMKEGPRLRDYIHTLLGSHRVRLSSTFLAILSKEERISPPARGAVATSVSNLVIDQIRLRMMSDWMTLTGQEGPSILALPRAKAELKGENIYLQYPQVAPPASDNPAKREADRPFDSKGGAYPERSPLNGFLTLRKELVLALIDSGLRWGALDFGPTSGDLMHFDSPDVSCDRTSTGTLFDYILSHSSVSRTSTPQVGARSQ
jgi:hypothetical protein